MDGTTILARLDLIFFYFSVLCSLSYSSAIELKTLWKIVVCNCRVRNCHFSKKYLHVFLLRTTTALWARYTLETVTHGTIIGFPFELESEATVELFIETEIKIWFTAREIISHILFEERTSFHTCSSVKLAFVIQEIPSYSHCQTKLNRSAYTDQEMLSPSGLGP